MDNTDMPNAVTVRGRLASPTELVLERPIELGGTLEVTIRPLPAESNARRLVDIIRALPRTGAAKDALDQRLRSERDAWDR